MRTYCFASHNFAVSSVTWGNVLIPGFDVFVDRFLGGELADGAGFKILSAVTNEVEWIFCYSSTPLDTSLILQYSSLLGSIQLMSKKLRANISIIRTNVRICHAYMYIYQANCLKLAAF